MPVFVCFDECITVTPYMLNLFIYLIIIYWIYWTNGNLFIFFCLGYWSITLLEKGDYKSISNEETASCTHELEIENQLWLFGVLHDPLFQ